jgi:sulfite reductase alpha subunit-like flavoprotein
MKDNSSDLEYKLEVQKATVYICGNGLTMVKGAEEVLKEILSEEDGLKKLSQENRYKKEVWMGAQV